MRPKVQKKFIFDNKCGCICDLGVLEKAMLWYSDKILMAKRKIYMHGNYPAIAIGNKTIHVHRLLMCHNLLRRLKTDEHIHHIDGNMLNSTIENLELTNCKIHIQGHLKGKKQDPEFARRRTNLSSIAKYGHPIKKH